MRCSPRSVSPTTTSSTGGSSTAATWCCRGCSASRLRSCAGPALGPHDLEAGQPGLLLLEGEVRGAALAAGVEAPALRLVDDLADAAGAEAAVQPRAGALEPSAQLRVGEGAREQAIVPLVDQRHRIAGEPRHDGRDRHPVRDPGEADQLAAREAGLDLEAAALAGDRKGGL